MKLLLGRTCGSNCGMEGHCFILCLVLKGLTVALNLWVGPSALFGLCSVSQGVVPIRLRAAKAFASLHVNDGINRSMCARACVLYAYARLWVVMVACHTADQQVVHSAWHVSHCAATLV